MLANTISPTRENLYATVLQRPGTKPRLIFSERSYESSGKIWPKVDRKLGEAVGIRVRLGKRRVRAGFPLQNSSSSCPWINCRHEQEVR